jgi:hypothetical protein
MTVPYDRDELYIGVHELKLSVEKNGYVTDMFHNFRVTGIYVTPVPTPEFQKILTDMNGSRIVSMATTVVPTATPTYKASTDTEIINMSEVMSRANKTTNGTVPNINSTVHVSTVPTTQPNRVVINVSPTPTRDQNIHVPLNPICGLLALLVAWVVVRR